MTRKPDNQGPGGPNRNPFGPGRKPPFPGKTAGFWILMILLVFVAFQMMYIDRRSVYEISYSAFKEQVESGNIATIVKTELEVTGDFREPTPITTESGNVQAVERFKVYLLNEREDFAEWITGTNPNAKLTGEPRRINWFSTILTYYLPFLLILGLWIFFLRQMQGGGNKAFSFGKSKAKLFNMDKPTITFEDVAGCDEAKVELQEVIDFLRSPKKFQRLGGRIPKGALLVGPPGTGKTLLGRAVAGEAGVPFFSMSGSDFVEMFVGVGASRVRDLFDQGKKNAPCIIFIDEIDAVGRHRGAGLGGGHDEREQTLNQLLVEMDGFESNEGVIILAATNRPDVLDPALMRPGRFDRQIVVDMPDLVGREAILKVHMRKVRMDEKVSARTIAAGTPGMAGADLENLVNEAALLAARKNHEYVTADDFEDAKEKVMLGPERRSLVLSEDDKRITAYHEAGHAVVAYHCEHADPVHKVTIIPRGQALGVTFMPAERDVYHHSRETFLDKICMALGGRLAEEVFLGKIHSGAYSDIKTVTRTARFMVTQVGMSDSLGPIAYEESSEQVFLGRDYSRRHNLSEQTMQAIDAEVRRIVEDQMSRARHILEEHRNQVETMVAALMERESLERNEVELIMLGEPLPPPRVALPITSGGNGSGEHSDPAAAGEHEGADGTDEPVAGGGDGSDAAGRPEEDGPEETGRPEEAERPEEGRDGDGSLTPPERTTALPGEPLSAPDPDEHDPDTPPTAAGRQPGRKDRP
ncbi:MAG: ATP-dependent zinc metalloprotease FtsH [Candidatus Krumholzibacteriia bacterium]